MISRIPDHKIVVLHLRSGDAKSSVRRRPLDLRLLTAPPMSDRSLFLLDDNRFLRTVTALLLRREGVRCVTAAGLEGALATLRARQFSFAILDYETLGEDPFAAIEQLREVVGDTKLLGTSANYAHASRMSAAGIRVFLGKPLTTRQVLEVLAQAPVEPCWRR